MTELEKKIKTARELQQDILAKQKMLDALMEDIAKKDLGFPPEATSFNLVDLISKAFDHGRKNA